MIFEISTFKLAKISSKILDTKRKIFFGRAVLFYEFMGFRKVACSQRKIIRKNYTNLSKYYVESCSTLLG